MALTLAGESFAYDAGGVPGWRAEGAAFAPMPERALAMAVLRDAVDCYAKYAGAQSSEGRRELADVRKWVHSRDRSWPFSFENICELFAIDAERLRSQLSRYELHAHAPRVRLARVLPIRRPRRLA